VVVTAANVPDRDGAKPLLEGLRHQFSRLRRIWADGAYAGELLAWVWALRPWRKVRLEIVKRPKGVKGFQRFCQLSRHLGFFRLAVYTDPSERRV
jgi:Transposase DDE domain